MDNITYDNETRCPYCGNIDKHKDHELDWTHEYCTYITCSKCEESYYSDLVVDDSFVGTEIYQRTNRKRYGTV